MLTVQIVPQPCLGVQEIHATLTTCGTPVPGATVTFFAEYAEFAHTGLADWVPVTINEVTGADGQAVVRLRKGFQSQCESDTDGLIVTATGWTFEPAIHTTPPAIPFSYDIADHLTIEANPWSVRPPQTTCAITAKLAAAGGTPLVDMPVTLTTSAGVFTNLTPANGHTDSLGQVHANLTGVPEGGYAVVRAESTDSCQQPIRQTAQVDFLQSTPDDWPMFMHDARHQGYSRYAAPFLGDNTALNQVWSAHVPTHQLESFYNFTLPFLDSSPVQSAGGPVLVGAFQGNETTSTGYLAAFDPNPANPGPDMQPLWRYPAAPQTIGGVCSTPAIFTAGQEKRVVFGSMDGKVYCLAFGMQGCTLCWSYQTRNQSGGAARILSSPAVYAGRVYITNDAARLYCLDAATGECKWMHEFTATPSADWGVSSPAVGAMAGEARLYVGGGDSLVYCLSMADNPTARVLWTYQHIARVESSPTLYQGNVYVGSTGRTLPYTFVCLAAETGERLWGKCGAAEVRATASAAAGAVFVGEDTGHYFSRLSAATGDLVPDDSRINPFDAATHKPTPSGSNDYFVGSPALTPSGIAYVGNDNWALYALGSEMLDMKAIVGTGGCVRSSPALTYAAEQGACWIYVTSRAGGGTLRAYRQGL